MSKKYIVLFFLFLIIILHHVFGYEGHFGFDDMHYAKLSKLFLEGHLDLINDHYTYRWTIIFTTALSYLVFGISDFTSGLGAMLCTIVTLYFTFLMIKKRSIQEIAIALVLVATTSWLLFYSDKLMPDLYIVLAFTAAFYFLYHIRFISLGKNSLLLGFLFTLSIFFGFLSKGTIVLFLPLFGLIFIFDIAKKQLVKFWISTIVSGFLIITIYLLIIQHFTGDAFYRFTAIKENSYLNSCSYFNMPVKFLLERISYGLIKMYVTHDLIIFYIFLLPAVFQHKISRFFDFNNKEIFFVSSSLILLVLANFMSISFTTYNPMCIDPRHYFFFVPIASIATAKVFSDFVKNKNHLINVSIILISILVFIVAIIAEHKSIAFWKYLPIAILLILIRVNKIGFIRNSNLWYLIFSLILIAYVTKNALNPYKENYTKQREVCKEFIENHEGKERIAVLTNNAQKRFGEYYLGFDTTKNIRFFDYTEDSLIFQHEYSNVFVLLNQHTRSMSFQNLENLPWYAAFADQLFEPVFTKDYIFIYELDKNHIRLNTRNLISSFHDFEDEKENWANKIELWDSIQKYSGNYSARLIAGAFSPTFSIDMDSIKYTLPDKSKTILQTSVHCLVNEETPAILVASLNQKGSEPYYWQASNINHFSKVFDNWEKAKLNRLLPPEIKDSSVLSIYVWNNGKEDLYIDDFEISLFNLAD